MNAFERIRSEFLEMPGLRLTVIQLQRLCGVERVQCQAILDGLVEDKFLCANPDGTYARLTEGRLASLRSAEVEPDSRSTRRAS
jgi:hypothetical protein